jgi:serine protease Do
MRQGLMGGLAAVALVLIAGMVVAPRVLTQDAPAEERAQERDSYRSGRHVMMLDGRGSSIGVRIAEADTQGVRIEDVDEGSPAEKAGVRAGDVVVEFDGERVRSARQFARLVQETPDGRTVKATIVRGGSRQTLDITPEAGSRAWGGDVLLHMPDIEREVERGLRALPRDFAFDFHMDGPFSAWSRGRLGVRLAPLTDQLAEYFGAKEGVLVSSVEEGSAAEKAGLKAGDVIVAVNGRSVDSPSAVTEELRDAGDGAAVDLRVLRDRKELSLKATIERAEPRRSRIAARTRA